MRSLTYASSGFEEVPGGLADGSDRQAPMLVHRRRQQVGRFARGDQMHRTEDRRKHIALQRNPELLGFDTVLERLEDELQPIQDRAHARSTG